MKDEYDFSNAKRGAVIPLTLDKAKEIIAKQQTYIGKQREAWDQYIEVSIGNAWYILGLELRNKHQQAKIDSLMLEYCPDEMTQDQMDNWEKHQVKVEEKK